MLPKISGVQIIIRIKDFKVQQVALRIFITSGGKLFIPPLLLRFSESYSIDRVAQSSIKSKQTVEKENKINSIQILKCNGGRLDFCQS